MKSVIKKQAFDYEIIAMAHHESSHVICALMHYLYVYNVNVMTYKNQEDGNTNYYVYAINDSIKNILLFSELHFFYAGLIGEKIYYKDICGSIKFPMHLKEGSSYDIAEASAIIRNNNLAPPGKSTFLLKKQIQYDVEMILKQYWDDVKIVAHALYQKKKLTFDDLKYLLTRKSVNKDFWKSKFKKIKLIHNDKNNYIDDYIKDII